jgi:hypothetical protein
MRKANRAVILGGVIGASMSLCSMAHAATVTFQTPGGATAGGEAVSAAATITTGAGTVSVTLSNTLPNIHDAGQLLSDIFFTLSGTTSNPTYPGGVAQTQNSVDLGSGNPGALGTFTAAWNASESGGVLTLEGLGPGSISSATCNAGPACLIIGPPTSSTATTATYSNANSSIVGNGPHNPLIFETATFVLDVTGVTAATQVSNVNFSFSTTAGVDVAGQQVPLPASIPLFGSGLAMIGWLTRRRKRAATVAV